MLRICCVVVDCDDVEVVIVDDNAVEVFMALVIVLGLLVVDVGIGGGIN
jgi:hypothetical protein